MAIQYRLLGPLEVLCDGARVQLTSPKVRTLLAAMVVHRNEVVSVDRLVDTLWGDHPPETAPAVLQTYVSKLRQTIDPDGARGAKARALVTVDPGYRLDVAADQVDADCFERLVAEGAAASQPAVAAQLLREALVLWRGPALSDFADEEPFHAEALRLDELRTVATEQRIDADIALGRHRELIGELTQLVVSYPLRERLWAQLMLCLYRVGRQAEALRKFQELRDRLTEELGLDPSPDLVKLERDILSQASTLDWSPPARSSPSVSRHGDRRTTLPAGDEGLPFVGRRTELAALREWWSDATAPPVALLSGEAGVGKTRLALTFARELQTSGVTVLYGRAVEEAGAPYQPVLGALQQFVVAASEQELDDLGETVVGALSRLVPETAERRPDEAARATTWPDVDRGWLLDMVASCLAGDRQDHLLVLDDLQWADRPALLLVARVAQLGTRARVVATVRTSTGPMSGDLAGLLAELRRSGSPPFRLDAGNLSSDDVADLLGALAGSELSLAGRAFANDIHRRTNGNSFFVRETIRHLEDAGAMDPAQGRWASERPLAELGVPPGVHEVITHRLRELESTTAEAVEAAAVLGYEVDVEVLVGALGSDEASVLRALDGAVDAGLLREDPRRVDRYVFVHALARDAALTQLSASRRTRLAWRAGIALEALAAHDDERAAELARYFADGRAVGDASIAVHWATRAGDVAMARLAYEDAVGQYDTAYSCLADVRSARDEQRADILIALGRACMLAGDPERWRAACRDAVQAARACDDPERLARAAIARLGSLGPGNADEEVLLLLEEAAAALREAVSSPPRRVLLAEVLARLSGYLTNVRPADSDALVAEAVATARESGDPRVLAIALAYSTQTHALSQVDHLSRLREAVELAERVDDVEVALLVRTNLMAAALMWADREEFDRRLSEYAHIAETTRSPRHLLSSAVDRAGAAALDGRYAESLEQFRAAWRQAHTLGDPNDLTTIGAGLQPVHRELGTFDVEALRRSGTATTVLSFQAALAFALCETGDLDAGADLTQELIGDPAVVQTGFLRRFSLAMLAEAVHLLGDASMARRLHGRLTGEVGTGECVIVGPNAFYGSVRRYIGLLDLITGDVDEAILHLEAALDVHLRMRADGWAARTRTDLGRAVLVRGRAGDEERAADLLATAATTAHELGMPRLLDEIEGCRR